MLEPQIGETKFGPQLGFKNQRRYIYKTCEDCGTCSWVDCWIISRGFGKFCRKCIRRNTISQRKEKLSHYLDNLIPEVGTVVVGYSLGFNTQSKYILVSCESCEKVRWVKEKTLVKNKTKFCTICISKKNIVKAIAGRPAKAESRYNDLGYKMVLLKPEDPLYEMVKANGLVLEHRIVVARSLGRILDKNEIVHHKNGIKDDNRLENLELTTWGQHSLDHSKGYTDGYINGLSDGRTKQIQELKKKVVYLREEVSKIKAEISFL